MEGIPTGIVGNAGPFALAGDQFYTKRQFILSDDIGLTLVRMPTIVGGGNRVSLVFRRFIYFNLV